VKLITKPEEIQENPKVYYMANIFIAIPEIDSDGAIKSINVTSLQNKGLIEIRGTEYLLKPYFCKNGMEVRPVKVVCRKELYYIPVFTFVFEGFEVEFKIFCDLYEKGFVYELTADEDMEVRFEFCPDNISLLRFNNHKCHGLKSAFTDAWLKNPCVSFEGCGFSLAAAAGADRDFRCAVEEREMDINDPLQLTFSIKLESRRPRALYVSLNADPDGAGTTLVHLRRKGFQTIYKELKEFLADKIITVPDGQIKNILNENMFFNYFFSTSVDFYSNRRVALTSRSSRYYVSGAFWERDFFLWSLGAIKLCDKQLYEDLYREMLITHHKNAGDHAHYIDGTVLYPGFELDEAAGYFIDQDFSEGFFDEEVLKAYDRIVARIEREFDSEMGLYRTFLLPSDDPADQEFVLIDNVILLRGYKNLIKVYGKLRRPTKFLENRVSALCRNLYKFIKPVDGKNIYVWSIGKDGEYRLYNDPPGNLGTLVFYGMPLDEVFKNTVDFYYSPKYMYYDENARFKELACDHHPNTPSGLGLCGSLLNPLRRNEALDIVKNAPLDNGLLCESFDKNTGEARTGTGFATGTGYLAFALYKAFAEGENG